MDYSVFEVFNAAEETINFGSRSLDEDNLYETCTLSTLSVPIEKDCASTVAPIVHSSIKNGQLIVAVNNRISVLSNLQCSAMIYTEKFDSIIDCFQLSDDAQILLLCLRSGTIIAIDLKFGKSETGLIIENSDASEPFFINSALETSSMFVFSFLVVNKKGIISRVCVKRGENDESLELIPSEIVNLQCDVSSAVYSKKSKIILLNGNELISYDVEKAIELRCEKLPIKSCFVYNKFKFIALLEDGQLCLISNNLLLCNVLSGRLFANIIYFLTENGNFLIALSKNESRSSVFELIKFPDYDFVFGKNISGNIYLIPPTNITGQYVYICNDGNGVLRICNIYETKPTQRINGLLRKGKYSEAEHIAAKFNLSKTDIYKARLNQMIEECILNTCEMSTLIEFLDKIDDVPFKLKVCIIAGEICAEFADVRRILQYGCDLNIPKALRIADLTAGEDIVEKMYLFETYMRLKKLTALACYDMKGWINFTEINLIAEVQSYLNNHKFDEAILLYSRFERKEFALLTDNDIKKMLHSLSSVTLINSRPFLCTFVPITLYHKPHSMSIVVSWVRQCAQAIESAQAINNLHFPESAIDLVKTVIGLLKMDGAENPVGNLSAIGLGDELMAGKSVDNSPIELYLLLDILESIKLLRDKFDVILPLEVYTENNRSLVHSFLMVPMELDNYKVFLTEFIIPYISKNNMNPDEVFLVEMKGLLAYEEKHWISIIPAIISAFKSVTLQLETVVLILGSVNPPWHDAIRALASQVVTFAPLDHPLVKQIKQCLTDEPIQIVLSKQLYSIPKSVDIKHPTVFKKIIQRITYCMIENSSAGLEGDIYTLCSTTELRDTANLILAESFINNGNVEKALMYIDATSTERQIDSCAKMLTKATNKISAGWFTDFCKPFWFEVFEPLISRLELLIEPCLFEIYAPNYLKIRTLALINTHFPHATVTLSDITSNDQFLTTFFTEQFLIASNSRDKLTKLIKIAVKIANKSEIIFLLTICERCNNLGVMVAFADFLHKSETIRPSPRILALVSLLLLRSIGNLEDGNSTVAVTANVLSQTMQNMSFYALEEADVSADINMNLHAVQLSVLLAEMAFIRNNDKTGDRQNIAAASEVFMWAISMAHFVRGTDPTSRGYRADVPTMHTFNAIRHLTALYCRIVSNFKNTNMEYLRHYTKESEIYSLDDTCPLIAKLSAHIKILCAERHHFTALHIVSTFRYCLTYATEPVDLSMRQSLNNLSTMLSAQVIQNILAADQIDMCTAFILLTQRDSTYTVKTIGDYFRMYRKNYSKLSQIADLGLRLTDFFTDQTAMRNICVTMKLRCKWMLALQPVTLSQQEFFTMSADCLLTSLMSAGFFVAIDTLIEFCADFNLIVNDYFPLYVQKVLLSWRPDQSNRNAAEELYDRCMKVARLYQGDLFSVVNSLWGRINCYYYEVYLSIIRILETLSPLCVRENVNQKTLLNFLRDYRRISKPGKSEVEEFFKRFPETHIAEPLAEFRLPFFANMFFSNKIMKILKPEINLNTYRKWFNALPALEQFLTKDYICCYVIRSVVTSGALQIDKSHDWMLFSVRSDLFDEIKECVTHIGNLDMATSALYHLTIHTPPGADQVQAAELCYTYAKKLRESTPETVDSATQFEKVKAKYYGIRVNQILHTYQLANDACLKLISDPNALIETIYMDPKILQIRGSNVSSCLDINEAAAEIAKLYDQDIVDKQKSLVETWLYNNSITSADETLTHVFHNEITNSALETFNDNFKRACYIFSGSNISYWQDYLWEIGADEDQSRSNLTKARALKCLYTISSKERIESLTEVTYDALTNFVDKLFLISDLERLGYTISVERLDEMNKIRLLQELTRRVDKHSVQIMAAICTTYGISDLKCWEFIINNFIKFEHFGALKDAINYVKDIQSVKYKQFYVNAWQCVLENDVSHVKYNLETAVDSKFVELVLMIQSCPILFRLNFASIVERFVQLGWWEFVAIFVQFLDGDVATKLIDAVTCHCPNIKNRLLTEYSHNGILISEIMRMVSKD